MSKPKLRALGYFGGKSPIAATGTGKWIASILPNRGYYAEPFAGMAGVLLCREKCKVEVLNDYDSRIISWWRAVRDHPVEMARLVNNTPHSREELMRAWEEIDDEDPLRRALNVHICIWSSFVHGLKRRPTFSGLGLRRARMSEEEFKLLSDRMKKVNLESLDVCVLMERLLKNEDMVIYLDPPYKDAGGMEYGEFEYDAERLAAQMQRANGFVAISGYNDEWDHLGFYRHEHETVGRISKKEIGEGLKKRVEVLWTNEREVQ